VPIPQAFLKDPEVSEWARTLTLLLDNLTSQTGELAQLAEALTTIDSQGTDILAIDASLEETVANVNTNTASIATNTNNIATNTSNIATVKSGSPVYTPTNVTTDRAFNADTAVVAEVADVLGTLIADLQGKDVLG
ncbi:MAG: hypothetical protein KJO69_06385, partial [Gammaproteobacteria bacterium]|nr:hypothetical protein [Gammaproteobacteria bacterium]